MMGEIVEFPLEKTKLYKWASKFVAFIKKGEPYEASVYASMTIPDQLKQQVQTIVKKLLNEK